ncbi:MAG: right-handed parallel beta-helix repeat-containing protein, partial [Caldilineaceae bacterium]
RSTLALVACFTIFLGIILFTTPAYAVDRNVDDNGPGCPGVGTPANFCTISAAVTAATAGDSILVADGLYAESVAVNKSLTIRGIGVLQTVTGGFNVTAANVKITGFTIYPGTFGSEKVGVFLQQPGGYVGGNTFVGTAAGPTGGRGIRVSATAGGATIAGNSFNLFDQAVYLYPGGGNKVISNTFRDVRTGLILNDQFAAVVKFNHFVGPFHNTGGAIVVNNAQPSTVVAWNQFPTGTRVLRHLGSFNAGPAGTLNAENNWWGLRTGPGRNAVTVTGGGIVDTTPYVTNRPSLAFDSVGEAFPGNVPSIGFQATQTRELGDHVVFQPGVGRQIKSVKVMMSSWGCQSGTVGPCVTTPGATFTHDITLKIYAVDGPPSAPTPGALLYSITQNFAIPYRPSADASCPNPTQFRDSDGVCNNGLAAPIVFDLAALNVLLPDQIIYGIAFNTSNHGYNPMTLAACNVNNTGCPYDSLNVGVRTFGPFAGTNVDVDSVYWCTTVLGYYTPPAAVAAFREDSGWTDYQPNVEFEVLPAVVQAGDDTLALNTGNFAFGVPVSLDVRGWPLNSLQFDVAWPACLSINPTDDGGSLPGGFVIAYQPTPNNPLSTRVVVSPPLVP